MKSAIIRDSDNILFCVQFQFQIGSIKSEERSGGTGMLWLFQFQIGSIKRLENPANHINNRGFNSKLVRLKAVLEVLRTKPI